MTDVFRNKIYVLQKYCLNLFLFLNNFFVCCEPLCSEWVCVLEQNMFWNKIKFGTKYVLEKCDFEKYIVRKNSLEKKHVLWKNIFGKHILKAKERKRERGGGGGKPRVKCIERERNEK